LREKALIKTLSNTSRLNLPRPFLNWLRPGLGLLISAGAILWLVNNLDFRQVWLALQSIHYHWVGLGFLTVFLTLWARVRRWQLLLDSRQITRSDILQALVLGQLFNLMLPLRLGDLGRIYLITKNGYIGQLQALGTITLEKLCDMMMLLALMIGLAWGFPLPAWAAAGIRGVLISAIGLFLVLLALSFLHPYLKFKREKYFTGAGCSQPAPVFERFALGLASLHRPQLIWGVGRWSVLTWLLGGLTNLSLLKAFDLPASPGLAFLLLFVLMAGVAIPVAPVHLGVFEGLCLVTLIPFGVESHTALAYGVTLHVVVLLPSFGVGVWLLLRLDQLSRQILWKVR
jgi:uncharacterized membrane protein YbhN (UPF0104 family)